MFDFVSMDWVVYVGLDCFNGLGGLCCFNGLNGLGYLNRLGGCGAWVDLVVWG